MLTLLEIYNKHKKGDWPDKGDVHSYIDVYEELFKQYRQTANKILEIGLMSGESLKMWYEYFDGDVYGMDCELKPIGGLADLTQAIAEGYKIFIGDASNPADVEKYFKGIKFDVVIEDANHDITQQVDIYNNFKPYLNNNSIYVIEDIQDVDKTGDVFIEMGGEIIDLRKNKGRYDDVLVIFKNK